MLVTNCKQFDAIVFYDHESASTTRYFPNFGLVSLHFSPDGRTLIVMPKSGWNMSIFDCGANSCINDIADHPRAVTPIVPDCDRNMYFERLSFSRDGKKVLLWGSRGRLDRRNCQYMIELSTGKRLSNSGKLDDNIWSLFTK